MQLVSAPFQRAETARNREHATACSPRAIQATVVVCYSTRCSAARRVGAPSRRRRDDKQPLAPGQPRPAAGGASDAVQVVLRHGQLIAVYKRSDFDLSRALREPGGGLAGQLGGAENAALTALTELERAFGGIVLLSAAGAAPSSPEWRTHLSGDFSAVRRCFVIV